MIAQHVSRGEGKDSIETRKKEKRGDCGCIRGERPNDQHRRSTKKSRHLQEKREDTRKLRFERGGKSGRGLRIHDHTCNRKKRSSRAIALKRKMMNLLASLGYRRGVRGEGESFAAACREGKKGTARVAPMRSKEGHPLQKESFMMIPLFRWKKKELLPL